VVERVENGPSLQIRMLGPLAIRRNAAAVGLPSSRKVRGLLAYLALAPHDITRTRLCEIFWDVPNDPRGELRWALSKIRGVLDGPGERRIHAQGEMLGLDLGGCDVDALHVARTVHAGPAASLDELRRAAASFAGDLLEGLEIDGSPLFGGWLTFKRREFRMFRTALYEQLVARVGDDETRGYLDAWCDASPFDERAHERLFENLARRSEFLEGDRHADATARLFENEGLDAAPIRAAWHAAKARSAVVIQPHSSAIATPAAHASVALLLNNLPSQLTSLIGREVDVEKVDSLMASRRLVTLVGSAGVGKTRASLQVGTNLLDSFRDGVWFIELAPLPNGQYLPTAVAKAMGITLERDGDATDGTAVLVKALRAKQAMLVFDNCEHVIETVGALIGSILRGCAAIRVLASSRQSLGITGETTFRMPSLRFPADGNAAISAAQAQACSSIALFVERAKAIDDRFLLTDENAATITEVCRRLDGIPLAIELAAARVAVLSPRQLLEGLNQRFRLLTGGSRDALPRQQTLLALIDWSYALLNDRERAVFRQLGVFVNGFSLGGLIAVVRGDGIDDMIAIDVLTSLVDKSLVLSEPECHPPRHRMLESTRAYARETLEAASEHYGSSERHLCYIRDLFVEARRRFERTGNPAEVRRLLTDELEDLRAALDWAADYDPTAGGIVLSAIGNVWSLIGLESEGVARLERFVGLLPQDRTTLKSELLTSAAWMTRDRSPAVVFETASHAVKQARVENQREPLAIALATFAFAAAQLSRFEEAEEALRDAEVDATLSLPTLLRIRHARGYLSIWMRRTNEAARAYEYVRDECLRSGDTEYAMLAAANLAEIEHSRGNTEYAITLAQASVSYFRSSGDRTHFLKMLANVCGYLTALDRLTEAKAAGREALHELREQRNTSNVLSTLEHVALVFALEGNLVDAAKIAGFTDAAIRRTHREREQTETVTRRRLERLLNDRITADELKLLFENGARLTEDAVITLGSEQ
jgi:predicted ATPase/DNA-binding SARP family transcriptional activator